MDGVKWRTNPHQMLQILHYKNQIWLKMLYVLHRVKETDLYRYIYGQRICGQTRADNKKRTTPVSGLRELFYIFLGWSVLCDPRVLSLYHTIFTCNFATLAILDLYLCNMCATKANKQSSHLWNKSDLALYEPNSCKFTNTFHLILLNPRVWP